MEDISTQVLCGYSEVNLGAEDCSAFANDVTNIRNLTTLQLFVNHICIGDQNSCSREIKHHTDNRRSEENNRNQTVLII